MGNSYTKDESLDEIVGHSITSATCQDISTYSKMSTCRELTSFIRELLINNFDEKYLNDLYISKYDLEGDYYSLHESSLKLTQYYLNIFFLFCLIKSSIQRYTLENTEQGNERIMKLLFILDKLFAKDEIKVNPFFSNNFLLICILETYSIIR